MRPALRARARRALLSLLADAEVEQAVRRVAQRSRLEDHVVFGPPERLFVGPDVHLNDALMNTTSGSITIEPEAFLGHGVRLLTGTHDVSQRGLARQTAVPQAGRDIVVERGAWISSGATVLGPCRVGRDAVVAAGAVVTADVPGAAIVAGVPARVVGEVDGHTRPIRLATDTGAMLFHRHDQIIMPAVRDTGVWEPHLGARVRALLSAGMAVADVGANVGYFVRLMATAVGPTGRVFAVEPDPANLALLRENVADLDPVVEVIAAAAWDDPTTLSLALSPTNTGDHRVGIELPDRDQVAVRADRLAALIGTRLDVLLLDTQATEHLALRGAGDVVGDDTVVLCEFWPAGIAEAGGDPTAVAAEYLAAGYHLDFIEGPRLPADPTAEEVVAHACAVDVGFATLEMRRSAPPR